MDFLFLKKSNKVLLFITFLIIFIYYVNYLPHNDKLESYYFDGGNQNFTILYGLWGLVNDLLFKFLDLFLGKIVTGLLLLEIILAFQLSILWALNIYRFLNELNFLAIIFFFHPFILNFFTLCVRDAIALALFLLVVFKGWNKFKLFLTIIISLSIHKGILPLIFTASVFNKYKNKSKRYFFYATFISILISIILFFLLRYTDITQIIPDTLYNYKKILSYPRIGFTTNQDISDMVRRAYNFYGDFNFKILCFGISGQILTTIFKNKFPHDMFIFCFSAFFICAAGSSIPNANRFIYHAILISFPFLISFSISFFKNRYQNIINS